MQFTVRMIGVENIADNKGIHSITAVEGTTLGQALGLVVDALKLKTDAEHLAGSSFLVNNKRAYTDYVLQDGDHLQILRTLEGG